VDQDRVMEVRNIVALPDGRFNCEIDHPRFGWIAFTASAEDVEPIGRVLHAEISAHGEAAMQIDGLRFVDAVGTIRGTRPDGSVVEAAPGTAENEVARTGVMGPVAAWVAPVPEPTMARRRAVAKLSRREFAKALQRIQMLTHADVLVFHARGIPAPLAALIARLPEALREDAEEAMAGAEDFYRVDVLWTEAVAAGAVTDAALDDLFGIA
jgi:hypothetical protein